MKITSGIYKNRTVKVLGNISRPTTVRSRTIIFDILAYMLPSSEFSFLDAFAGSGIMGMEALSRYAANVIFFEINKSCIKLIEENLKKMEKITGNYVVHKCNTLVPPKGSPVDAVFLDPPYDKPQLIYGSLKKLYKYNWINEETIIIIETSKFTKLKPLVNFEIEVIKSKLVSSSLIRFCKIKILN